MEKLWRTSRTAATAWTQRVKPYTLIVMRKKPRRLRRLSRIEGQVRGLTRMVENNRYCIDIVTQIAAVRRAEEEIFEDHVANCVEHAIASGDKRE
jgi:CsoR family transcriptional regulator, copper-sensing transcriptional repressor